MLTIHVHLLTPNLQSFLDQTLCRLTAPALKLVTDYLGEIRQCTVGYMCVRGWGLGTAEEVTELGSEKAFLEGVIFNRNLKQ